MVHPQKQPQQAKAIVRAGFTLMELMVVVAILVVLIGVAVPIYIRYLENSKVTAAQASVENLSQTVQMFYTQYDRYPNTLEELMTPPDGLPLLKEKDLYDPWRRKFLYINPGTHNQAYGIPDIWSEGPPNRPAQIGNWEKGK